MLTSTMGLERSCNHVRANVGVKVPIGLSFGVADFRRQADLPLGKTSRLGVPALVQPAHLGSPGQGPPGRCFLPIRPISAAMDSIPGRPQKHAVPRRAALPEELFLEL